MQFLFEIFSGLFDGSRGTYSDTNDSTGYKIGFFSALDEL